MVSVDQFVSSNGVYNDTEYFLVKGVFSMTQIIIIVGLPIPLSSVSNFYGTGDSSVVITNVSCSGDGNNIFDCQYFIMDLNEGASCNEVAVICQGMVKYRCNVIDLSS